MLVCLSGNSKGLVERLRVAADVFLHGLDLLRLPVPDADVRRRLSNNWAEGSEGLTEDQD